jgi:hypothetical protein
MIEIDFQAAVLGQPQIVNQSAAENLNWIVILKLAPDIPIRRTQKESHA